MTRRGTAVVSIAAICVLAIGSLAAAQIQRPPLVLQRIYYLFGNLEKASGTVTTDKGRQPATFSGMITFQVAPGQKGELRISLVRFNLVARGAPTAQGDSGVIGLHLAAPEFRASYDPKTGRVTADYRSTLHYELIDRIKGYRQVDTRVEDDVLVPFTEEVAGRLTGRLPAGLQPAEKGTVAFDGETRLEISSSVLGAIRGFDLIISGRLEWILRRPAERLRIQPVFIGTGPADPTATGTQFTALMNRAHEIWGRCGTVRCLAFDVKPPLYVNNPAYRVLDDAAERAALRGEVDVADAIEVFVVERWALSLSVSTGGGSCFSSGTASAKIVTSDQQLAIPCPAPCSSPCPAVCPGTTCQCGPVNVFHMAHELGHALNLAHPGDAGLAPSTAGSIMVPSGFCCDNPGVQSARNCRNASNPLLYWGRAACLAGPDIMD
ncbi:MAG: hypothetical protein QME77_03155 [bacterium]|nr:hypothetical protein [bacterium]